MAELVNSEAEAALITSLIFDPEQVLDVADLDPDDFTSSANAKAFKAICKMVADGEPVDVLTLKRAGITITQSEMTGQFAPASEYAEMVKDSAYRRRIVQAASDIAWSAEHEDVAEMVAKVEAAAAIVKDRAPNRKGLGVVNLFDFRAQPPAPMLGVLSPDGTTVLYGEGGDGKGWIAAALVKGLAGNGIKTAVLDFENHPNEWAYRFDRLGMSLENVLYVQPGGTMEKWADARAAGLLRSEGVGFLVVDSAMYASNTDDPYSPQSAMQYKRARARLGNLPALLLAHTAKGSTGIYGSVFWRNEARITWHLFKDQQRQRQIECKKSNVYNYLEGQRMVVEFNEELGVLNLHPHGTAWTPQTKMEVAGWG